ncbi:hypothetical protein BTJ40_18130 [Microbulbifer sp. A4B17]|uniref:hypothetical protein n=1 Tax=Microbulbifer sp. A4B17 TaxID=359370 RepID=UPI000D52DFB7|nr:hypothetical protein [Microbulbifer sp. A4B17]AWF82571.1 hypothetical protein BTJ40_18130 [Microbulbifer sp. A4B17]
MNFLKSMVPVFVLLLTSQSFAEMVFVSGVKHNITEYSYNSDTRRVAEIDVLGDSAQEIRFDITAVVSGLGRLRPDVVCRYSYGGEHCYTRNHPRIFDYVYDVSITASCIAKDGSKTAIGIDRDDKNIYTNVPISDFRNEVVLTIDNGSIASDKCDILTVDIQGDLESIDDVDLKVFTYEAF